MLEAYYLIPTYCEFALATLGIYDYLLTFNQELRQIWQRKLSWTSVLFFCNRYLYLATAFTIFVKDLRTLSPTSRVSNPSLCTNLVLAQIILDAALSICSACFYSAQTYALFNKPNFLLVITSVLGASCPIISVAVWAKAATISLSAGQLGERCSTLFALENGRYIGWLIAARACNLAANLLVLGLIVFKTCEHSLYISQSRLSRLLFKQGALHFIAIAAPNIVALCLSRIPVLGANIPLHADSATSILISRFIITLRRRYSDGDEILEEWDCDSNVAGGGGKGKSLVFRHRSRTQGSEFGMAGRSEFAMTERGSVGSETTSEPDTQRIR